jgi:hypothetical protein
MNSPPSSGNFSISPTKGYELTDPFQFAACSWEDDEIPLSYQFGFTSGGSMSVNELSND